MAEEIYKEASYYEKAGGNVRCRLCPQDCSIKPGAAGVCKARGNIGGRLYSLNYGRITSIALDPIEKKPLNRFFPGSYILSAGSFGCNLKCSFCQNWSISQVSESNPDAMGITSEILVQKADELKGKGNIGIAYTYNEPFIWFEFVLDTAILAKKEGLCNVLVTNGFVNPEPLAEIMPFIDAMNIDVKSFSDDFYRKICGGRLEHVMKTVGEAASRCHVEVTTLIIPDLNDSIDEIDRLAKWLSSVSPDIPLHLSRYFPNYKLMDKPPTSLITLEKAYAKARKHLKYVYLGNI